LFIIVEEEDEEGLVCVARTCEAFELPNSVISNGPCDDFNLSYTLRGVMYN